MGTSSPVARDAPPRHEAGRNCPLSYRYAPAAIATAPTLAAEVLYVAGGLYGNRAALDALLARVARERQPVTLAFNGDFNWFNVDPEGLAAVNETVLRHAATRGNVETEMAGEDEGAGCGCAYPEYVGDEDVERSNRIIARLRASCRARPGLRARLASLPMFVAANVGRVRVAIVHGDASSLAGWGFSAEALRDAGARDTAAGWFEPAGVRVFACSHTCLPVMQALRSSHGRCIVANNGAAGMPNFSGIHWGIVTRIARNAAPDALYGASVEGVRVEAVPVQYDHERFAREFLANWPPESPAHASYFRRIVEGPQWRIADAVRTGD